LFIKFEIEKVIKKEITPMLGNFYHEDMNRKKLNFRKMNNKQTASPPEK